MEAKGMKAKGKLKEWNGIKNQSLKCLPEMCFGIMVALRIVLLLVSERE